MLFELLAFREFVATSNVFFRSLVFDLKPLSLCQLQIIGSLLILLNRSLSQDERPQTGGIRSQSGCEVPLVQSWAKTYAGV